jgi:predicted AAA+ superfamily ATPase
MIEKIIEIQLLLAKEAAKLTFKRYLYNQINWHNRLIGIIGSRGTGKTTLLLQYYLNNFSTPQDCLYLSADNVNVINRGLFNIAEEFFNFGGKAVIIDEAQKYPDWQAELKNIYDSFPAKKIVFSGSSSVNILKGRADLSRRVVFYNLKGLSFREFLALELGRNFQAVPISDLLKRHTDIASSVSSEIAVLKYFRDYLKFGYYPFFKEGKDSFYGKLNGVLEKVFYEDIPSFFNIKPATVYSLKKLFYLVATSQPFIPNIARISSQLSISKEYIYAYIDELEKAGLFTLLYNKDKGFRLLRKPQKIYLENPNLFALVEEDKGFTVEKGSIRETFFLNQLSSVSKVYATEEADFIDITGGTFEVGGKNKSSPADDKVHILAVDEITVGFKRKIPLWLFGFLY